MCFTPIIVRKDKPDEATVPCGRCPECKSRRAQQWSFRLMQEDKISDYGYFVTLTYKTENLQFSPIGKRKTLHTPDLQNFFKRLRKYHGKKDELSEKRSKKPIKYYAAGEYGTINWRPHYHIIIFNATCNDILRAWTIDGKEIGSVHISLVNGATVGYTLKYISKEKRVPEYRGDDRIPERSWSSKGIGINYLSPCMRSWHLSNGAQGVCLTLADGKRLALPRYYRERIGFNPEVFEESRDSYLCKKRKEDDRIIARIGADRYYRERKEKIDAAFRKMRQPDKNKKL